MSRFSSIRLLLTNTLVPRDTKSLVAGVSAKRVAEPHIVDPIMEAIQEISDEAKHLLGGGQIERAQLVSRLEVSLPYRINSCMLMDSSLSGTTTPTSLHLVFRTHRWK
jgi:mevalonate kinase